ncbi:MAG: type II secretion system protein [Alphaproteobacteria bacterium]|nr:MAG: type II secretion system protein [Alphaproteobacteria bacterium]
MTAAGAAQVERQKTRGRTGRNRRAGFTLIELLVAFVVMGLVLAAVYRGFAMAFDALSRLDSAERRVAVAENRLAELGVIIPLAPGRYDGVEAEHAWEVTVTPLPVLPDDKTRALGVMPARIEVRVHPLHEEASFRLVSYRLMPLSTTAEAAR